MRSRKKVEHRTTHAHFHFPIQVRFQVIVQSSSKSNCLRINANRHGATACICTYLPRFLNQARLTQRAKPSIAAANTAITAAGFSAAVNTARKAASLSQAYRISVAHLYLPRTWLATILRTVYLSLPVLARSTSEVSMVCLP